MQWHHLPFLHVYLITLTTVYWAELHAHCCMTMYACTFLVLFTLCRYLLCYTLLVYLYKNVKKFLFQYIQAPFSPHTIGNTHVSVSVVLLLQSHCQLRSQPVLQLSKRCESNSPPSCIVSTDSQQFSRLPLPTTKIHHTQQFWHIASILKSVLIFPRHFKVWPQT